MSEHVVVRLVTPTVIAVQLGALATVLSWLFAGPIVGGAVLAVSLLACWRAIQTGFVLDDSGLGLRPFFAVARPPVVPWEKLQSVDVDHVVVGSNEDRRRRLRVRFMAVGPTPHQLIGIRPAAAERTLAAFRARGIPATDTRDAES